MDYQNIFAIMQAVKEMSEHSLKDMNSIEAETDEEWEEKADKIISRFEHELEMYKADVRESMED